MSRLLNIDTELNYILKNYWKLDYNDLYLPLSDKYAIRVTKFKGGIWFEVDVEPLLEGCYLFSSQDLKEVLEWCYNNLNIELMYY